MSCSKHVNTTDSIFVNQKGDASKIEKKNQAEDYWNKWYCWFIMMILLFGVTKVVFGQSIGLIAAMVRLIRMLR